MNKLALQLILALAMGLCGAFAESAVSPDGKYIVFVKTVSGPTIGWGAGEEQPSELWQTDADGGNAVLLCRTHSDDDMREVVAAFKDLRFSPDGRLVYFTTPAAAQVAAL
jgi:Tol biopolymer transport system component